MPSKTAFNKEAVYSHTRHLPAGGRYSRSTKQTGKAALSLRRCVFSSQHRTLTSHETLQWVPLSLCSSAVKRANDTVLSSQGCCKDQMKNGIEKHPVNHTVRKMRANSTCFGPGTVFMCEFMLHKHVSSVGCGDRAAHTAGIGLGRQTCMSQKLSHYMVCWYLCPSTGTKRRSQVTGTSRSVTTEPGLYGSQPPVEASVWLFIQRLQSQNPGLTFGSTPPSSVTLNNLLTSLCFKCLISEGRLRVLPVRMHEMMHVKYLRAASGTQ